MCSAHSARSEMQIRFGRGGHEVIVFSSMKFHSSRGGTERSKTDGVVAHLVGFITSYYGSRMCVHDSAHVKLFFVDMVNDKLFSKFLWYRFVIEWTHNVDLVILHKAALALVHIYDVIGIVNTESAKDTKEMYAMEVANHKLKKERTLGRKHHQNGSISLEGLRLTRHYPGFLKQS